MNASDASDLNNTSARPTPGRRFSSRRIAVVQSLRAWKRRRPADRARPSACHSVQRLLAARAAGRLGGPPLPPHLENQPFRCHTSRILAGWVGFSCLTRRHEALLGRLVELAELLGCSSRSVQNAVDELLQGGWLEREHRFLPSPGFLARDGRRLKHRQVSNAYRPGPILRLCWQSYLAGLAAARRARAQRSERPDPWRRAAARAVPLRDIQDRSRCDPTDPREKTHEHGPYSGPVGTTPAAPPPPAGPSSKEGGSCASEQVPVDKHHAGPGPVPAGRPSSNPIAAAVVDKRVSATLPRTPIAHADRPAAVDKRPVGAGPGSRPAAAADPDGPQRAGAIAGLAQLAAAAAPARAAARPVAERHHAAPAPIRECAAVDKQESAASPADSALSSAIGHLALTLVPIAHLPEVLTAVDLLESADRDLARRGVAAALVQLREASAWLDCAHAAHGRPAWEAGRALLDELLGRAGP